MSKDCGCGCKGRGDCQPKARRNPEGSAVGLIVGLSLLGFALTRFAQRPS